MSRKTKTIDYLFEDPPLSGQRFALVSIVGPHMPQKCEVYGLKVRGTADSLEKAKALSQKLMRIDNNFDIYTVEVGKFFPLAVEPHQVSDVQYQNEQLNQLVKNYLENRERANEEFLARKNELVKEAVREGKQQEELASRPEHPIAVLQRIKDLENRIKELEEQIQDKHVDLQLAQEKFSKYTEEERQLAVQELESSLENATEAKDEAKELSVEEIRQQLLTTDIGSGSSGSHNEIEDTLKQLQEHKNELTELLNLKSTIHPEKSPYVYKNLDTNIQTVREKIDELKKQLNSTKDINQFINSHYSTSANDYLFN